MKRSPSNGMPAPTRLLAAAFQKLRYWQLTSLLIMGISGNMVPQSNPTATTSRCRQRLMQRHCLILHPLRASRDGSGVMLFLWTFGSTKKWRHPSF